MIKCIIVDDEPLALRVLEKYIGKIKDLEILGQYTSALEALEVISTNNVDVIFLDIQMSEITGVQFVQSLKNPPMIVFTTAYNKYAMDGHELNAMDYLLKPISFERFLKTVNRINEHFALKKKVLTTNVNKEDLHSFIFLKAGQEMVKVEYDDILYIEGLKDYVKIFTRNNKSIIINGNLKSIENKLPARRFARIHKSTIVSIDKIDSIHKGRIKIGQIEITIGDLYKEIFTKIIGNG
ncbi:MAG: putative response regulatory protein [Chitinophagaceae bacterium]|nr:putative response regulatory protein [Chitinophagaceae bacterium]